MKWNKFHLDTAKNLPLYQLLADQLRQKILTGVLAPGEKLPGSRELQKLLRVSAVTIEGGLNILVQENFLCRRPRCGTFVADELPVEGAKIDPPQCIHTIFSNMDMVSGYWSYVLSELERQFRAAGYLLCFHQCGPEQPGPMQIPSYRNCAGIVLCGYNSLAYANEIRRRKVPVVLIGSLDADSDTEENLDMVVHNDQERAKLSTAHLLDLGHRRIACVTGPAHSKFSADQKAGFLDAMLEYGMRPAENDFFDTAALQYDNGIKVGYEIFCRRNRPTAIFAGNDYVAFGIIDTAKKLGLSVPEEFSIIGCGGMMPGDSPRTPILTTTRSLPEETARFAVEKLLRQIHEPGCPNSTTVIRVDTICYGETTRIYRQEPASGAIPVDSDRLIAVP